MKNTYFSLFIILMIISPRLVGQTQDLSEKKDIGVFVGLGLTDGNDYEDDLREALGDGVTGYLGWINIDIGLQFKIIEKLYLVPNFRWMAGRVATTIKGFESAPNRKVNSVFLLGSSFKYYILEQFYGQFSLSKISTNSEVNDLTFEPDGIETGFSIGYEFFVNSRILGFELGYTLVPVKSVSQEYNWSSFYPKTSSIEKDYGGLFLNVKAGFQLGNYN